MSAIFVEHILSCLSCPGQRTFIQYTVFKKNIKNTNTHVFKISCDVCLFVILIINHTLICRKVRETCMHLFKSKKNVTHKCIFVCTCNIPVIHHTNNLDKLNTDLYVNGNIRQQTSVLLSISTF